MLFLGIDPGASGGLALVAEDGTARAWRMPKTEAEVWEAIGFWKRPRVADIVAVIEQVQGYVGGMEGSNDGSGPRGSAMFKFGQSYGGLRMALVAASIPFRAVVPRVWQGLFGLYRGRVEPKTAWKRRLRDHAAQLFPQEKVTLAVADALLIAEYCRRTWK